MTTTKKIYDVRSCEGGYVYTLPSSTQGYIVTPDLYLQDKNGGLICKLIPRQDGDYDGVV